MFSQWNLLLLGHNPEDTRTGTFGDKRKVQFNFGGNLTGGTGGRRDCLISCYLLDWGLGGSHQAGEMADLARECHLSLGSWPLLWTQKLSWTALLRLLKFMVKLDKKKDRD